MKLGEKIKFIRNLRGMTQKELGLKVGFSPSTADIRIRQYELGKMKPKEDKLELIANALDVPISSLNDIDLSQGAESALLNVLFELERTQGLNVEKVNDRFVLSFNSDAPLCDYYNEGLSAWYYARKKFFPSKELLEDDDIIHDYQIWTQEYPKNTIAENEILSEQVKQLHSVAIETAKASFSIKTIADFIKIFETMFRCEINIIISRNNWISSQTIACMRIRFAHKELLSLKEDAIEAYARFIALIDFFEKNSQSMVNTTSSYDNVSYDEYNILSAPLATALASTVIWMQEHIKAGTFDEDDIQNKYNDDLKTFNVPIEDYIYNIYTK